MGLISLKIIRLAETSLTMLLIIFPRRALAQRRRHLCCLARGGQRCWHGQRCQ